eukprot:TRINITY_DN66350_c8_g3_i1.p1 TRINITY_DN66350_c8_g3~~TRINITY_DN66350_c8_g3_i1.p1  ORF type:complete len:588 (-),score=26.96 TRINITY_DN66350_c8_g3_i1:151-1914(-)
MERSNCWRACASPGPITGRSPAGGGGGGGGGTLDRGGGGGGGGYPRGNMGPPPGHHGRDPRSDPQAKRMRPNDGYRERDSRRNEMNRDHRDTRDIHPPSRDPRDAGRRHDDELRRIPPKENRRAPSPPTIRHMQIHNAAPMISNPTPAHFEQEIQASCNANDYNRGVRVYKEYYFTHRIPPSLRIYSMMIKLSALAGNIEFLGSVLDDVSNNNVAVDAENFDDIVQSLVLTPYRDRAMQLFIQIIRHGVVISNPVSYLTLIRCCMRYEDAMYVMQEMRKQQIRPSLMFWKELVEVITRAPLNLERLNDVIKDMAANDITPNHVLLKTGPDTAQALFGTLSKSDNWKLDAQCFELLVTLPLSVDDNVNLVDRFVHDGGAPSARTFEGLLDTIASRGTADNAYTILRALLHVNQRLGDDSVNQLLSTLSRGKDVRIFEAGRHIAKLLNTKPSLGMFHFILEVCAHHFSTSAAKDVWRAMQMNAITPDKTAIQLLLQACSKDAVTMAEVYNVIKLSQLTVPVGAEHFIYEAYQTSEQYSARLPDIQAEIQLARRTSSTGGGYPTGAPAASAYSNDRAHRGHSGRGQYMGR